MPWGCARLAHRGDGRPAKGPTLLLRTKPATHDATAIASLLHPCPSSSLHPLTQVSQQPGFTVEHLLRLAQLFMYLEPGLDLLVPYHRRAVRKADY
jgi:hypothetical protein